jgi:CheY-like chemotaxis protein
LSPNDKSLSEAEKPVFHSGGMKGADKNAIPPLLMSAVPAFANQPCAPRVLVTDDAAGMRRYLTAILTSAGFACVEAANGEEAFNAIVAGGIDLLVTDLDMPVMDGFKLISAASLLRTRPPIIVVSALLDENLASHRPEPRSAQALLAKPVEPAHLLRAVARVLYFRAARS